MADSERKVGVMDLLARTRTKLVVSENKSIRYHERVHGEQDNKRQASSGEATGSVWHGRQDFTAKHETGCEGAELSSLNRRTLNFESKWSHMHCMLPLTVLGANSL